MAQPSAATHAATPLLRDLRAIFGDRLESVVAYGPCIDGHADAPLTCLALARTITAADLDACAQRRTHWKRQHVAAPLLLSSREFADSLDAFPLEYGEIIRAHQRLLGDDPFTGVSIALADIRRACETQVKSHLLHLRQGFVEAAGEPRAIGDLVRASAPAFAALLRNIARLAGCEVHDRRQSAQDGVRAAGLGGGAVDDILAMDQAGAMPMTDAARLFPDYLAAVEQLAHTVDRWSAQP